MSSPSTESHANQPAAALDWVELLSEQLSWHWDNHLRPRLDGLSDDEYFWEPAPDCWSLRPRARSTSPVPAGTGELVADFAVPEPSPAPVTTIAWRLGHLLVGIFGARNAAHFGGPPIDYLSVEWPTTAAAALDQLDAANGRWMSSIASLDAGGLARPVGEAEGPFAESPMAALILHIHREVIHHGAEILLLRDLYRARGGKVMKPAVG
jgi:hypothetical protein